MTKALYPRLGKFLKKARIEAGLTQHQVAEKLGLKTAQFISNWERGISSPPMQSIHTIVNLYGLDGELLLRELLEVQKLQLQRQYELKRQKIEKLFRKRARN